MTSVAKVVQSLHHKSAQVKMQKKESEAFPVNEGRRNEGRNE